MVSKWRGENSRWTKFDIESHAAKKINWNHGPAPVSVTIFSPFNENVEHDNNLRLLEPKQVEPKKLVYDILEENLQKIILFKSLVQHYQPSY